MTDRAVTSDQTDGLRRGWIRLVGGASALMSAVLLLLGIIGLGLSVLRFQPTGGWLSLIQSVWLVKIMTLHAGLKNVSVDLHGLNLLDVLILLLVGVICLGISTLFKNARRTWSLIAGALSVIAIALFIATQNAGRSTVMLAVLIISFVLWGDKTFGKATAFAGILAGVFLFAGDLTVGIQSDLITALFGLGYLLLVAWFFLVAWGLLRAGSVASISSEQTSKPG